MTPHILILYAEAGAGHRRAAQALAQSLSAHGATATLLDAMRFMHPLFRTVYVGGGLGLITRLPRLYHLAYHLSDRPEIDRVLRGPRYHAQQISTRSLFHAIESFQPAAIVCTHFLPAELCAGWRRRHRLTVPLCTVITDFDLHCIWQHAGTDWYGVPTEAARDRLIHAGIDPARVTATGIPIEQGFAALPDRSAAARRLGLGLERPIVLIMGGGLGVGALEAVAQSLRAHPLDAQIIFITGSNHALRHRLTALSRDWIVRGFVSNMPDWLAAADVAISKAGGLAGSELLAAGVPTIIPRVLAGHEARNAAHLAATGAALLVDSAAEALAQADRLLHEPSLCEAMHSQARLAARPYAADLVADQVIHTARIVTQRALRLTNHVDYPSLSTL